MPGRQRTIRRPADDADVAVLRRRLAEADARAEQCEAACAATRHELDVLREQSRQHTQQLLEAQVALEESHDRYVSLYDFAPVAFVSLDQRGIVRDLNLAAAQLLGAERSQLLHAPMLTYVHPASKRAFLDHMLRCRRGNVPAAPELDLPPRPLADLRRTRPASLSTGSGVPSNGAGGCLRTALLDLPRQRGTEARERLSR